MVVLCLYRQVDKFLILFHNPADVSYKRLCLCSERKDKRKKKTESVFKPEVMPVACDGWLRLVPVR